MANRHRSVDSDGLKVLLQSVQISGTPHYKGPFFLVMHKVGTYRISQLLDIPVYKHRDKLSSRESGESSQGLSSFQSYG